VVRGEVFRLRAPRGRERFAVVVQADELLALSTVLVAPTSRSAAPRSFRPAIELEGESTRVLVEHTTAVAPDRLGDSVGRLSALELRNLDAALSLVFGL
jgi:mRNA interferase MazF